MSSRSSGIGYDVNITKINVLFSICKKNFPGRGPGKLIVDVASTHDG